MKAELLLRERVILSERVFAELKVWKVPAPVRGSRHDVKYSLALVADRTCVLRYDNEAGKGDHRHVGGREEPYRFEGMETVVRDFWRDVDRWMSTATS